MSIRGVFASHSGIVGDRQTDLSARVLMTMPGGTAPLLALSSGMPKARAADTAFSWIEDSHISGNTKVVGTVNSAALLVVVADSNIWVPNSIIMNEDSGEYMLVTSVAGNSIGIARGFGGTTPAELTNNDTLQLIGSAFEEGGGKPTPVSQRGASRTNYTQIFKNGWAITGTAQSIDYLTGSQLAMNREQCFAYHAEDIERSFIWGKKDVRVVNNRQFRMSDGILNQIKSYGGVVEAADFGSTSGAMALAGTGSLTEFMRRIFDVRVKGMSNERIAFCGSIGVELINQMILRDGTYNISQGEDVYGIKVMTLSMFNGSLKLMQHPLMVENSIWQHELYVFHPGLIRKREKRPTWTEEFSPQKQNNNGTDATEGYIGDELGFEVKGAKCFGIMTNIQTSAESFPPAP